MPQDAHCLQTGVPVDGARSRGEAPGPGIGAQADERHGYVDRLQRQRHSGPRMGGQVVSEVEDLSPSLRFRGTDALKDIGPADADVARHVDGQGPQLPAEYIAVVGEPHRRGADLGQRALGEEVTHRSEAEGSSRSANKRMIDYEEVVALSQLIHGCGAEVVERPGGPPDLHVPMDGSPRIRGGGAGILAAWVIPGDSLEDDGAHRLSGTLRPSHSRAASSNRPKTSRSISMPRPG